MANFDFILPSDSKLYKGENEKVVFTDDTHTWFAEEEITAQKINEYPNVIHIPGFDLDKAIELDREKEKRKPKLRMLPPINILS